MTSPAHGQPTPPPPPEAALLRIAREALGLSPEQAASRALIQFSGARWRQIEAGYRKDTKQQVDAPAATLAHLAHAVGITPGRLAKAGRSDAAEILGEIQRSDDPEGQPAPQSVDTEEWRRSFESLSPEDQMSVLRELLDSTRRALGGDNERNAS